MSVCTLQIEELILEWLAWRSDSPVWEAIKVDGVPQSSEVSDFCRNSEVIVFQATTKLWILEYPLNGSNNDVDFTSPLQTAQVV